MTESMTYSRTGATGRDQTHTLFAQTMQYVAMTTGLFALGAYLGRDLHGGVGILAFIAAFGALIALQFAVQKSTGRAVGLLAGFGLLMGLAVAPTLAFYASVDPEALWEAGGATALFVAGFGAAGYATRRDLSAVARISSWGVLGLIAFGIVLIFVQISGGALIYSLVGLVLFAGLIAFDFQRLRQSTDLASAPLLAASIFLDILNVFLFFLQIFTRDSQS
ncbi:Bax inhibitor-1 family protein [Kribbella sp. NPDC050124]|uniref:Bax inhibitor-1 family protein n=1 Tax=Kribbella sp. NPDC050124 TaxID=3364114 RepID=UPI0037943A1C